MAELSTIARPYATGLMKALKDRNAGVEEVAQELVVLENLASISTNSEIVTLVSAPELTDDQNCDLIAELCGAPLSKELANLLRVVIENGRLEAMPEIARQFRELKNLSEGIAEAHIETAFELSQTEVDELLESLSKKFPGFKLTATVVLKPELLGGVCIRVGDKVLDGSVRTRLSQMKTTLTA